MTDPPEKPPQGTTIQGDIAIGQSRLGMVLKDLGQLDRSIQLLKSAPQSLHERLGSDHPHTKNCLGWLNGVRSLKQNQKEET
jgi:hypothetical protein